ncbi:MAG: NnrU family protein [Gammaproteobacteria bacterium]|nr:NnrU family protein [Gammaproteobacteria bacterium]
MTEFLLAITLFVVAHAVPPAPPVRRRLVSVLGRRLYLTVYSLVSLVLLAWVISAAVRAPLILLWAPAGWQWVVPVAAMPLAFWFLVAGLAEANPLSISFRRRDPAVPLPPIVRITRHPVIWGFLIWAGAHVPPNGDVVSLILFGGMTVYGRRLVCNPPALRFGSLATRRARSYIRPLVQAASRCAAGRYGYQRNRS